MAIEFTISTKIPASPMEIYHAWLDSKTHGAITGAGARVSAKPGESFTVFDDYASGRNLQLIPGSLIVQSWRTTEFLESEEDSLLEIHLEDRGDHTLLSLRHTNLPPHGIQYKQGWVDHYFEPMKVYFSKPKV